ncbi:MAG: hypothetical protein NTV05_01870 [Acidobacteria bacterium]|nr:hypothetical protein [Acidobacteriota bacterium]
MSSLSPAAAADAVLRAFRERAPLVWRDRELPVDLILGAGGLDLDSIAIVELLIACQSAVGIPFPPALFDEGPLTLRRLIDHATQSAT